MCPLSYIDATNPAAVQAAAMRILRERAGARMGLREYAKKVNPRFTWYRHCEVLGDELERVVSGDTKRLMVFCPPRHGKSELVSRIFPGYFLRRHPDKWVGLASYGADLAYTLSRNARNNYQAAGAADAAGSDTTAVQHWETGRGGGMWAGGVGGALTGKGFHLGIVDDPIKNDEEASSERYRQKQKDWWRSTFYTRAEPDAAVVVVLTRWHEDDLAGWLLAEEKGDVPERWRIVCLPAIAEDPPAFPSTCSLVPDWRQHGEALCPERYGVKELARIRSVAGSYYWSAQYQQRPAPEAGDFFRREHIGIVGELPPGSWRYGRAWDLGATAGDGDYTVGVKLAYRPGDSVVADMVRGQWSTGARDQVIRQTAEMDGRSCTIYLQEEPGSAGKDQSRALRRMLEGFPVVVTPATGSKLLRARPLQSAFEAGSIKLLRGDWNKALISEMIDFPHGRHDDAVDALSEVYNRMASGGDLWAA